MNIADTKAIYEISKSASGADYVYKYGIVAYNSVPTSEYETLNRGYFESNNAKLSAPINSVYVETDSGSPYFIVQDGVLTGGLTTALTSGSNIV